MEFLPKALPAAVRQFVEAMDTLHPGMNVVIEKGGDKSGDWWIDVGHRQGSFVVQWLPDGNFGLHPAAEIAAYGELPPERYSNVAMLLRRVEQLLDAGEVGAMSLRDMRGVHGLSQAELAARLGVQQAAVSKVERRQDLHLDTLSAIITALGGTLEMKVKFPGGEMPLRLEP